MVFTLPYLLKFTKVRGVKRILETLAVVSVRGKG